MSIPKSGTQERISKIKARQWSPKPSIPVLYLLDHAGKTTEQAKKDLMSEGWSEKEFSIHLAEAVFAKMAVIVNAQIAFTPQFEKHMNTRIEISRVPQFKKKKSKSSTSIPKIL